MEPKAPKSADLIGMGEVVLGVNEWHSRGAQPPPDEAPGLIRYTIVAASEAV